MQTNFWRLSAAIYFFIAISSEGYAQANHPKAELGGAICIFVYQGDLTPSRFGSLKTIRPGLNFYYSKLASRSIAYRTNLAIGILRGNDAVYNDAEWRQQRNFNFRTPVIELSELLVWNPLAKNYDDKGFSPYLFTGAGLSLLKVKRDWSAYNPEYFDAVSDVTSRLTQDATQKPPRVIPVIPAGIGFKYSISPKIGITAEGTYRFLFTDYLDGFSKAANPELKDHYYTVSVGAMYRIGKKNTLDCPRVGY